MSTSCDKINILNHGVVNTPLAQNPQIPPYDFLPSNIAEHSFRIQERGENVPNETVNPRLDPHHGERCYDFTNNQELRQFLLDLQLDTTNDEGIGVVAFTDEKTHVVSTAFNERHHRVWDRLTGLNQVGLVGKWKENQNCHCLDISSVLEANLAQCNQLASNNKQRCFVFIDSFQVEPQDHLQRDAELTGTEIRFRTYNVRQEIDPTD